MPVPQFSAAMWAPDFSRKRRRLFGCHTHRRGKKRPVGRQIISERADDARRTGGLGGSDGQAEFVERRLGFDDDGIHPSPDQGGRLFGEGALRVGLRQVAVRFEHCAQRPDVAQHKSITPAKRLARDADARRVDGAQVPGRAVPRKRDAVGAEGVGDQAIRARGDITLLDGQDAVGMLQIPQFAAVAAGEAGEHELGAHRTVTNEAAFPQSFQN